jgi:hypothetical protein
MWFPHHMCRRRSHTLSLNPKGENHLLSEKGLNLVTQAIPPPTPAPGVLEGRATKGGALAREFQNPQGGTQTRFGRVVSNL